MKPGYSKLLINEIVMPEEGAYWEATALDMVMLTLFSSQERTLPLWRRLLEDKAGLKIARVWSWNRGVQSLIECHLSSEVDRERTVDGR